MNCKTCYYFEPRWIDEMGCGGIPASCNHPDCFESILRQTFEGKVYKDKKRVKDIVDFNPDGNCQKWTAFHYKKIKTWWIFKKVIKVKGIKAVENNE